MTIEERNQLVEDNQGMVRFSVQRYRNILPYDTLDELVSLANLAVVIATKKYNPKYEFTTFIDVCIKNKFMQERCARRRKCRGGDAVTISLDASVFEDEDSPEVGAIVGTYDDDAAERMDLSHAIREMMKRLTPQEKEFITLRCADELSYREIAERYGCKWQRVQQVINKGLAKMAIAGYHEYAEGRKKRRRAS